MTLGPSLVRHLFEAPYEYDFFQAVRLLEQLYPERAPVGNFADPSSEVVRFSTPSSVAFPASQIQSLEEGDEDSPARMQVNFFGMLGPQGVMPLDYSLYAARRERAGDHTLKDFLGLFEHRILSLFYRAWTRSHPAPGSTGAGAAQSEGEAEGSEIASSPADDWLTRRLLSIVGLMAEGLRGQQSVSDEALLYYAGLLSLRSRPAAALEQLVADYFEVPCTVEQFVGAWYPLASSSQTALGDEVSGLGLGAVAGDEIWDQQARVRVRIGPLTRRRYEEFLPGGPSYRELQALTTFFGNDQFDFEIQLVLARDEAPPCRLDPAEAPLSLGWVTWLHTAPMARDPDDAVFTLSSP